jgi:cell division transport system permease protein
MPAIPLRPETGASRAMAVIVTALMVALGLVVLAGAMALRHVDQEWRRAFAGRWTVEVAGTDTGRPPAADEMTRLLEMLRATPGIADARPVEPAEVRRLLRPWLGDVAAAPDLPLPTLIDVRLDADRPPAPGPVAQRIAAAFPDARLDDHGDWTRNLARLAKTGETLGLALLGATALTAAATVATTARARLAINRPEIELLHGIGATDAYIVRQFEAGALRSAVAGAVLGTVIAGAGLYGLVRFGGIIAPLARQLRLTVTDGVALTGVPVAAVLLAIIVTRAATLALVRRLP